MHAANASKHGECWRAQGLTSAGASGRAGCWRACYAPASKWVMVGVVGADE